MAFLDKLKFWKRKEVDFEKDLGIGLSETALQSKDLGLEPETGLPREPSYEPTPSLTPSAFKEQAAQQAGPSSKDIELISSKLDTIKAMLENMNNRLAAIEREYHREEQKKQVGWYA